MKYCTKCLMPNTRPSSNFDTDNICEACSNYKKQKNVNDLKEEIFQTFIDDRAWHIENVILPALEKDFVVLCGCCHHIFDKLFIIITIIIPNFLDTICISKRV